MQNMLGLMCESKNGAYMTQIVLFYYVLDRQVLKSKLRRITNGILISLHRKLINVNTAEKSFLESILW